jgi:hypothetical protein
MATLYVTEYEDMARDAYGNVIQAGKEPAIASQTITVTSTSAKVTNAFSGKTRFVRLNADAAMCVKFGSSSVTAAQTDARMSADQTEFFGVSGSIYVAARTP